MPPAARGACPLGLAGFAVVHPAAGDLAFGLPASQRGGRPARPAIGHLALTGDGVAGAGSLEPLD